MTFAKHWALATSLEPRQTYVDNGLGKKESSNISTSSFQAEFPLAWFSSDDKIKRRNKRINECYEWETKRNTNYWQMEESDRHFEGNFWRLNVHFHCLLSLFLDFSSDAVRVFADASFNCLIPETWNFGTVNCATRMYICVCGSRLIWFSLSMYKHILFLSFR